MAEDQNEYKVGTEVRREVIYIRQTTTTREAVRITITQRVTHDGEIALATAVITGKIDRYFEKPDFMEDLGIGLINSAHYMRKFNKYVDGKR